MRRYGGAGFALELLPATVTACIAQRNSVEVIPQLDDRDRSEIEKFLERLSAAIDYRFSVVIESIMPQHIGLGSKTALLLATGLVCNTAAGNPLARTKLISMSNRGGTSGVGVNTAFVGGFVIDGGHHVGPSSRFYPSSHARAGSVPPVLVRLAFPEEWRVHLFLPDGRSLSGRDEVEFFERQAPISSHDVHKVMAAIYHGVAPAIAERNLTTLKSALQIIQRTGFKRREVIGQGRIVQTILDRLDKVTGLAAGMSSLGPLVYAITTTLDELQLDRATIENLGPQVKYLGCIKGRNHGYEVERG